MAVIKSKVSMTIPKFSGSPNSMDSMPVIAEVDGQRKYEHMVVVEPENVDILSSEVGDPENYERVFSLVELSTLLQYYNAVALLRCFTNIQRLISTVCSVNFSK